MGSFVTAEIYINFICIISVMCNADNNFIPDRILILNSILLFIAEQLMYDIPSVVKCIDLIAC